MKRIVFGRHARRQMQLYRITLSEVEALSGMLSITSRLSTVRDEKTAMVKSGREVGFGSSSMRTLRKSRWSQRIHVDTVPREERYRSCASIMIRTPMLFTSR